MLHLFSCCSVFYIASFFKLDSFHVAPFFFCIFPPVITLFSCCSFFMLHFFQFGPSLLTCFLFDFFHDVLLFGCFSLHCALFTLHCFMLHSFLVVTFRCTWFLMLYSFHNTFSKSMIPKQLIFCVPWTPSSIRLYSSIFLWWIKTATYDFEVMQRNHFWQRRTG